MGSEIVAIKGIEQTSPCFSFPLLQSSSYPLTHISLAQSTRIATFEAIPSKTFNMPPKAPTIVYPYAGSAQERQGRTPNTAPRTKPSPSPSPSRTVGLTPIAAQALLQAMCCNHNVENRFFPVGAAARKTGLLNGKEIGTTDIEITQWLAKDPAFKACNAKSGCQWFTGRAETQGSEGCEHWKQSVRERQKEEQKARETHTPVMSGPS